jgi:threonine dehydrogenase-like Zn-dependent dehydrogenase
LTGYFSVANRDLRRRQVSSHTVQQSLLRLRQIRCVASRLRQPGDRVSVPFNVACGTCRTCTHGWTSFCLRTNPAEGVGGAAYGYAQMGPYQGGQAEFLRVPFADFNLLPLLPGTDFERDFTMLSDISRPGTTAPT